MKTARKPEDQYSILSNSAVCRITWAPDTQFQLCSEQKIYKGSSELTFAHVNPHHTQNPRSLAYYVPNPTLN